MHRRLQAAALAIAAGVSIAACQTQPPSSTPTDAIAITPEATVEVVSEPAWREGTIGTIRVGIWQPPGWTFTNENTVTLLQHNPSLSASESAPQTGIIVNVFAPHTTSFDLPPMPEDTANPPLWVFRHLVADPTVIGYQTSASQPVAFDWHNHPAAYYLLSSPNHGHAIIVGVMLNDGSMLGINVSLPSSSLDNARETLAMIFNGFTVDGETIGGGILSALPAPAAFPRPTAITGADMQIGGG
jgi:hypothetical protein